MVFLFMTLRYLFILLIVKQILADSTSGVELV